jgi:hypothetical protein
MQISWFTLLVLLLLFFIVSSLAFGLYYLIQDQGRSKRTLKALTIRITLSLILFPALLIAFAFGVMNPHPLLGIGS